MTLSPERIARLTSAMEHHAVHEVGGREEAVALVRPDDLYELLSALSAKPEHKIITGMKEAIAYAKGEGAREDAAAQAPAWLPIDSAPKDGTYVLTWCRQWQRDVISQRYLYGYLNGDGSLGRWSTAYPPTHWWPHPHPPCVGASESEGT